MSGSAIRCAWFLAMAMAWPATAASGGDGGVVALVTDLQGEAVLAEADVPAPSILSELHSGSVLQLRRGARAAIVYLDSGQEFTLTGPAEIEIAMDAPRARRGAAPVATGPALGRDDPVRIHPPAVSQAAIALRADDVVARSLELAGPQDGIGLEESPRFAWQPPAPGLQYRFELFDDSGRLLHSTITGDAHLQLPAHVELASGRPYSWLVSARDGARTWSGAGEFSIATPALRAEAAALRPAADAPVSRRVAYASWLLQNDLRGEAGTWWRAIAGERRDAPALRVLADDHAPAETLP